MAAIHAIAWIIEAQNNDSMDVERRVDQFHRKLSDICNFAMPKSRSCAKNSVYWWNPDIEELRKKCLRDRRAVQ